MPWQDLANQDPRSWRPGPPEECSQLDHLQPRHCTRLESLVLEGRLAWPGASTWPSTRCTDQHLPIAILPTGRFCPNSPWSSCAMQLASCRWTRPKHFATVGIFVRWSGCPPEIQLRKPVHLDMFSHSKIFLMLFRAILYLGFIVKVSKSFDLQKWPSRVFHVIFKRRNLCWRNLTVVCFEELTNRGQ